MPWDDREPRNGIYRQPALQTPLRPLVPVEVDVPFGPFVAAAAVGNADGVWRAALFEAVTFDQVHQLVSVGDNGFSLRTV